MLKYFSKFSVVFWCIILVGAYLFLLPRVFLLNTLYHRTSDLFLRLRHSPRSAEQLKDKLVIVNIDESSLEFLGQRWPIKRSLYGKFIDNLYSAQARPAALAIDITFAGKSDDESQDLALSEALRRAGNAVIASYFDKEGFYVCAGQPIASSAFGSGFINYPRDYDQVIRRFRPLMNMENNGGVELSFALKTYSAYLANKTDFYCYDPFKKALFVKPPNDTGQLPQVPLLRNGSMLINYFLRAGDFVSVPLWKVLNNEIPPEFFNGKTVFVGSTMELYHDIHPTPLGLMPGVLIHANMFLSFLMGEYLTGFPSFWFIIILLLTSIGISIITNRFNNVSGFIFVCVVVIAGFILALRCIHNNIIFDYSGFVIVSTVSFFVMSSYKYIYILLENQALNRLAVTDGLTGLYVFRFFEAKLASELRKSLDKKSTFSLVIFDVDHFKNINDTYGHEAGNEVLRKVALVLKNRSRPSDTVARFGGEEFAVILAHTGIEGAQKYAEYIRKAVEELSVTAQEAILKITISAGVCSNVSILTPEDLIRKADSALYEAKKAGRNKVVVKK